MVRAAALVSGDGAKLQAILDSMYFKEIENFKLVAVISPEKDAYAMKRALNTGPALCQLRYSRWQGRRL